MTRSVIMNFESGFLDQQKLDTSAQQKEPNYSNMPGVSRSMPDLYSCADNIESQIATLKITSEEIIVDQKLSPHQHSVDNSGDCLANSSSLNCLGKSSGNQAAPVPLNIKSKNNISGVLSTSSSQLSTSVNLQQLSARSDADVDKCLEDETTTADSVSLSEEKLEFTEVSLNNSEDDAVESPRDTTDINASVRSSFPEQRKNGVMDSFFDWLSPTSPTMKSSSAEANDSASMCSSSTSPSLSKATLFKSKNYFFWNKPIEPLSTTALILEDRPRNLPKKPLSESEKHRMEYERMVERARKNKIKEGQIRRKKIKEQLKQEESIASIGATWQHEILPQWASMRHTLRVRQLWWNGLPPNVRGKVWQLAIGNDLNLTTDLYEIMVSRAHEKLRSMNREQTSTFEDCDSSLIVDREDTVELIRLDISRTFPKLCIFQKGGPYHDALHDILGAYVCYRPDVGYVQGMSFIAAMLLLNMEPCHVFFTFANTLNRPCQIAFFRLDEEMMKAYFAAFEVFFEENLPRLFAHFKQSNLTPDMYLIDWIFTMFSKSLNLDTASRVWDVFCRDGEEFLFKTAIGILKLHRDKLLGMEFIHCAQFLTKLPPMNGSEGERLFRHIADLTMISRNNRRWKDVLSLLLQQRKDDPTTSA